MIITGEDGLTMYFNTKTEAIDFGCKNLQQSSWQAIRMTNYSIKAWGLG